MEEQQEHPCEYVRIWKRDGTVNFISLRTAIGHLVHNSVGNASSLKHGLQRGVFFATPLSVIVRRDVWERHDPPEALLRLINQPACATSGNPCLRQDA